jgi:hypothetical protein
MELNGDQSIRLANALNSAFPAALGGINRVVTRAGLGAAAAGLLAGIETTYSKALDNLVTWAIAQNRVEDLLRAARRENPGNRELEALFNELSSGPDPDPDGEGQELDRMTKTVLDYLNSRKYTSVSLKRLQEARIPLTAELLNELIASRPETFRYARIEGGPGIAKQRP